jgi:large subunit ribosomal protein L10
MNRENKTELVNNLHAKLEKAKGTYLVDYQGLDVEAINSLRNELRKSEAEFKVVKNRLLKLASKNTETSLTIDFMRGPSAITITYEDVVAPAKALVDFAKDNEQLEIKGGQISGKVIDYDGIKRLSALPGRDQLLAQTLSAMQAVPGSFVRVLNAVIVNLLNVLKAVEEQKKEQ